jgi:hypothetical protein
MYLRTDLSAFTLFNNTVGNSDYMAWNYWAILNDEFGTDVEGVGSGLI